ncbi:hypothetical protein SPX_43880 [Sporomusa paucivorans]
MPEWHEKPTVLGQWPEEIRYIMFIDESGHPSLKAVRRAIQSNKSVDIGEKCLVVTGMVLERPDYPKIRSDVLTIKNNFWPPEGMYFYEKQGENRRVCFHSEDIRKQHGPFKFGTTTAQRTDFLNQISQLMENSQYKVLAAGIDKEKHVKKYKEPTHPYNLCMTFILERFCLYFLYRRRANGIIILESRGKTEDKQVLKHLVTLINSGTNYTKSYVFQRIQGIYFNPKWCFESNCTRSYLGNELADLIAYPIHKYIRDNIKDPAFNIIEKKLDCYPQYFGKGLKIFP